MENNITLTSASLFVKAAEALRSIKNALVLPFELVRSYYSYALERQVSMRQSLHITNAQLAFFATFLPADAPVLFRLACLAWFGIAAHSCYHAMKS